MLQLDQEMDVSTSAVGCLTVRAQATALRRERIADRNVPPAMEGRVEPIAATSVDWYTRFKAFLEYQLALVLMVLCAPVIALTALVVKLSSSGPVFYSQTRVGKDGRPFRLFKVRTMYHNCERSTGPVWSTKNDPRITPVGRVLRATHLDELPQLYNGLRGEMSLIGPRPERPEFLVELEQAIPGYAGRHRVRPGITGLAQILQAPDSGLASVRRKLKYDLLYISRANPRLDLQILFFTALRAVGIKLYGEA